MRQIKVTADDRPVRKAKRSTNRKKKVSKARQVPRFNPAFLLKPITWGLDIFEALVLRKPKAKAAVKKTAKTARRRPPGTIRKIAIPAAICLAIALPVGSAGYYIVANSIMEKSANWIGDQVNGVVVASGLTVQEISVIGRKRTSGADMMEALAVARGDNILTFDPVLAQQRIEALGWVSEASVMRRFPDEIFIRISERRPFARWQEKGKTVVIDRAGAVVTRSKNKEFRYLPKVVGARANQEAAELFDILAQSPTLFTRLHNAVRIRDRRWNLEFDNGVTVMMPEEGLRNAWTRLGEMHAQQQILNKGILAIDLRSGQKTYVRLKSDDAEFRKVAGEKT